MSTPAPAYAATSSNLNYQARLLNSSGSIVPDGYYNIEFKLYSVASGGSSLWSETYYDSNGVTAGNDNRVRVVNGYLSVNLASQTAFPAINWDQDMWLTMNIGGATQTATPTYDGEMTPRIKLTAVPYAFQAKQAERLNVLQGGFSGELDFATLTANRKYLLPDTNLATTASPGTVCVFNGAVSNCPAATGSASYIQNTIGGPTPQTEANFNIQATNSGANGTIGGIIRGAAGGQTVDLLQLQSSAGAVLSKFDANGYLSVGTATSPTGGVATFNGNVGIGTTSPTDAKLQFATGTTEAGGIAFGTGVNRANLYQSANDTLKTDDNLIVGTIGTGGTNLLCYDGTNKLSTCSAAPGAGSYIYNGTGLQTNGNFNIQAIDSGITGTIGGIIRGAAGGQTADLFQLQDSAGAILAAFNASGQLVFGPSGFQDTNLFRDSANVLRTNDALTVDGLLTGSLGATVSGAAINLNNNSNFATNINTGTSTGAVSIGNSASTGFTLENGTGAANLFNGDTAHTVNLATGAAAQTVTIGSTNTTSTTSIQGGTTGSINLGSVGSSTLSSTTNIANTTDATGTQTVNIGSAANAANVITLQSGATGGINLNSPTISTNATTLNLFETNATTINFGNAVGVGGINFAGGSGSTGCTVDGSTGNLICSGTISGSTGYLAKDSPDTSSFAVTASNYLYGFTNSSSAIASGVLNLDNGTNTGNTLRVTTAGNPGAGNALIFASNTNASPTGNLLDLQSGSIPTSKFSVSATGLLTGVGGATISGAAINLNNNSNFATNINTGTSTGAVAIGNSVAGGAVTLQSSSSIGITSGTTLNLTSTGANNINLSPSGATNTGVIVKPGTNSTAAFQVQNAAGTAIFAADTVNQTITITSANNPGSGNAALVVNAAVDKSAFIAKSTDGGAGLEPIFLLLGDNVGDKAFQSKIAGETFGRFSLSVTGVMEWGSGAVARDTNLYRSAANVLQTDDAFIVGGLLTGQLGGNISGGIININNNSNFATNINTGTSTGAVTIGNSSNAANAVTIEAGTGSGAIQIGNGATAHGIQIGTSASAAQTIALGSTNAASATNLQGGITGGINIGTVGAATTGSSIHIADTSNGTGVQGVTIGSSANAANAVTLQGGATGGINLYANGSSNNGVIVRSTTANSTAAFQIQNASNVSIFTADTTNTRITIGGATGTLANRNLEVAVAEVTTTFRIGNATNSVGITNAAAGGQLRYNGTARNMKNIGLLPEYAGAVLTGDGTNNVGAMTSDFCGNDGAGPFIDVNTALCASGEYRNYYSWTSQATNDYNIYVRYKLPQDFDGWSSSTAMKMTGWRTSSTEKLKISVWNATGGLCGTETEVNTANATWQQTAIGGDETTDPDCNTTNMAPGSTILIVLNMEVGTNNNFIRAGELSMDYWSKF
ncbi:MAG: beta strand repeat-containing protein [Candidatus Saccharimonadales bacterium]